MEHINKLVSHSDIFKLHYQDNIYIFCHFIFLLLKLEYKIKEENINDELNRMFNEEPDNHIFSFFTSGGGAVTISVLGLFSLGTAKEPIVVSHPLVSIL